LDLISTIIPRRHSGLVSASINAALTIEVLRLWMLKRVQNDDLIMGQILKPTALFVDRDLLHRDRTRRSDPV
jgi:hypothetical protein